MAGKKLKFPSEHLVAALLREPDPTAALRLFHNPPNATPSSPLRYSTRCYEVIISKLAAARLFPAMESILSSLPPADTPSGAGSREHLLCAVISAYGRARLPAAACRAFAHPSFPEPRTAHAVNTLLNALLTCRSSLRDLLSVCRDAGIPPDERTYDILMRAAATSGTLDHLRQLFDEMMRRGIEPTVATLGTIVDALCNAGQLEEAFEVKEAMVRRYKLSPNAQVYSSLIKGLCRRGEVDAAVMLKDEMARRGDEVVGLLEEMKRRGIAPHRVVYNALIAGLCEDVRDPGAAFAVLGDMEKLGCKPDAKSYSMLVRGLCKLGRWQDANELVEDMPRRGCTPDVVTYRILFDGLCDAGEFHEANQVFADMVFKGFAPSMDGARKFVEGIQKEGDAVILESVLCRLAKVNALESGGWEKAVGGILKDPAQLSLEKHLGSIRLA
ncbi:hypothetical protein BS78_09G082200 [Paspalum vaginatum]|nr:hypothetical protein BS78_09G082200 [Paspalum vaginatum]